MHIYVFQQSLRERVNLLLFCLAVADLGVLLTQLLFVVLCYLHDRVTINNWVAILNAKVCALSSV